MGLFGAGSINVGHPSSLGCADCCNLDFQDYHVLLQSSFKRRDSIS